MRRHGGVIVRDEGAFMILFLESVAISAGTVHSNSILYYSSSDGWCLKFSLCVGRRSYVVKKIAGDVAILIWMNHVSVSDLKEMYLCYNISTK